MSRTLVFRRETLSIIPAETLLLQVISRPKYVGRWNLLTTSSSMLIVMFVAISPIHDEGAV